MLLPLAALVSSLVVLLGGGVAARAEQPATRPVLTLSVTGRGWGHGVGMSQWGAYGFAQQGASHEEILAHYYRGTELGKAGAYRMRVLLVEAAKSVAVASAGPIVVEDADGAAYELAGGAYTVGPELKLKVEPDAPARALPGPLTFGPKGQPLSVNGKRYRGTVEVAAENGRLRAVSSVPLEAYLLGVVPSEVPSHWPAEALAAQAVAARSYALATRKPSGPFDAYADVRSQVYGGIDAEKPETTAAVQATAGQVVLYQGRVATTYFFSSSGGRTADVREAWPGAQPVPYLVSVPDPYDTLSPHHSWGPLAVSAKALRTALKLPALPIDARVTLTASGRAGQLVLTLPDGSETAVPAATVRTALGLRSTWFRPGVLGLRPPVVRPVTFGVRARLGAFTRAVSGVTLERKPAGGVWAKVSDVPKGGTFAYAFRGERTGQFRLATAKVKGAPVTVPVAPRVTLDAQPGVLQGKVRPVLPGTQVTLERQQGARWVQVATASVDEQGQFSVQVELTSAVYRARVAARPGYAAGLSRTLSVSVP